MDGGGQRGGGRQGKLQSGCKTTTITTTIDCFYCVWVLCLHTHLSALRLLGIESESLEEQSGILTTELFPPAPAFLF